MSYGRGKSAYTVRWDPSQENWVLMNDMKGSVLKRAGSKSNVLKRAREVAKNQSPAVLAIEDMDGGTQRRKRYD